jgi:SAM-dependent methyltransferase
MSERSTADFKSFEAGGWTAQAGTYGELSGRVTSRFAEPLLDAAAARHGDRVLDVGTGPGYVAERAAARGARPVGIDIAEGMLALARRRHPKLEFRYGDAEDLPFDAMSFDAVVGNFAVNHLPQPERAMTEVHRVLAVGGGCAFSVWDGAEGMPVMALIGEAIDAAGAQEDERSAGIPPGPDPYRFAEAAEFRTLLEGAGLAEVVVESVGFVHRFGGAEELWNGFMGGSVRGATFVRAQPEPVQARVRAELERVVDSHRADGQLELQVRAKIAAGRKR